MMRLACILIVFAVVGAYAEEPEQLVNGRSTSIEKYPHACSMRMHGNHMCGVSIISNRYVITAAHCLVPISNNYRSVTIVCGTDRLNAGGDFYPVEKIIVHPNYDRNARGRAPGYDIGLIKVSRDIQFSPRAQPVKLPSKNVSEKERCSIGGWGSTGNGQSVHNDIREVSLTTMSASECQRYHQNTMQISRYEFCTLVGVGTGTCHGDSGSGVTQGNTIIGLVSGGIPCARGYPDVKTSVYPFNSWIRSYVPNI